ncbi:MAG: flagellar basal body P-ring formation chaperone FlgA [Pirellulales bacterium]
MNTIQQRLFRILLATIVVALNVLPIGAAEIVLQAVVVPRGTVVRLGDVAKVEADDKQEAARLAAIPLLPAPGPGRQRFLRMREVQDLLATHGEDLRALDFRGELVVEIAPPAASQAATMPKADRRAVWSGTSAATAASMTEAAEPQPIQREPRLTEAQSKEAQNYIERAVIEHLNRSGGRKADWKMSLQVTEVDLAKVLTAKSALRCSGGVSPWTGQQRLVVAFSTERGPVRVRLTADVTLTQAIVVATQPIERGHVITAADVAVEEWDNPPTETGRRKRAESLESLIGMEAARPIQAGDAIFSDDFRPQLLVKRGEEIAVYARGGGIQVRTIARAKQDGARGELIGVESLDAKEPFDAVVVGPREAVVFTASAAPTREKVVEQPFRKLRQK